MSPCGYLAQAKGIGTFVMYSNMRFLGGLLCRWDRDEVCKGELREVAPLLSAWGAYARLLIRDEGRRVASREGEEGSRFQPREICRTFNGIW